jgi:acyl-CoA reductase-like NAD-dependent aldehyde dehydrogenase
VLRLAGLLDHLDELAMLDTLEVGKPIRDTVGSDLPKTINMYRWYAEAIDKIYGAVAPASGNTLAFIGREPLGVIGAVTPWNFPLYVAAYKTAPALVTGDSIVHKPAEQSRCRHCELPSWRSKRTSLRES